MFKLSNMCLFTALFLLVSSFSSTAKNTIAPTLLQYIINDIEDVPSGSIFVPQSSSTEQYQVSWLMHEPLDFYTVEVLQLDAPNRSWQEVYKGINTELEVINSVSGVYVYRVNSCDANSCSNYLESSVLTLTIAADGPSNVVASTLNGINTVTWSAIPSPVKAQQNYKKNNSNQTNNVVQVITASTNNIYHVEESINGDAFQILDQTTTHTFDHAVVDEFSHQYRVKACSEQQCTKESAPSNIVNGLTVPQMSNIEFINNTIALQWQAVLGADSYKILVQSGGGHWVEIDTTTALNYTFDNPPEGNVQIKVAACDSNGCYGASTSTEPIEIPLSSQCKALSESLRTFTYGDNYFIGNIKQNMTLQYQIPGLTVAHKTHVDTYFQQYWQLVKSTNDWALSDISAAAFRQQTKSYGGLYLHCRVNEITNNAELTFTPVDKENSLNFTAELLTNNEIILTLISSKTFKINTELLGAPVAKPASQGGTP
ncbi:MAG: hypothetical protein ACI9LM_000786 [Alteromonadaceae bacterium]|jgi:hypothetical protein